MKLSEPSPADRTAPGCIASERQRAGSASGRLSLLFTLLLALIGQSFVTQTHRHQPPTIIGAWHQPTAIGATRPGDDAPADTPADCPLCREAALAGSALLPTAIIIEPPLMAAFVGKSVDLPHLAAIERSHIWRSRAPPSRLQA